MHMPPSHTNVPARPSTIHVRKAGIQDVETLVAGTLRLAQEDPGLQLHEETVRHGVTAVITRPALHSRYYLALAGNEPAGQILVSAEWNDFRGSFNWWLRRLYVRDCYRRQGVARALIRHVRDAAVRAGSVRLLWAGVRLPNKVSRRLFENEAFTMVTNVYVYDLVTREVN
jgi:GNAT superfamily N-acetyltransferase